MATPEKDNLGNFASEPPLDKSNIDTNGAPAEAGASANEKDTASAAGVSSPAEAAESSEASSSSARGELDAELEAEVEKVLEDAEAVNKTADNLADEKAVAEAQAAEWKDKYVRLHAEWDTYRRRTKEQREEEKARAAEKLVVSLLPILDDLERTIDYAEKNGENGLLGGVQAVLAKFVDTLQKDGVRVIDPKGEAFDALEAQAVGTVDDPSQFDETVADVYQKGYAMGNKVLRPAMVTVTTGGEKRPTEDE